MVMNRSDLTLRSCIHVREKQEASEDAVGSLHAQQGALVCGLQVNNLTILQLQDHPTCGDLEGVLGIVTEGEHFLHVLPIRATDEVHTQVPSGTGVVREIVEARHFAGELPTARLIVFIHIGDNLIKANDLVPPQDGIDGPQSREGYFLCSLVVPRVTFGTTGSRGSWNSFRANRTLGANFAWNPRDPWISFLTKLTMVSSQSRRPFLPLYPRSSRLAIRARDPRNAWDSRDAGCPSAAALGPGDMEQAQKQQ